MKHDYPFFINYLSEKQYEPVFKKCKIKLPPDYLIRSVKDFARSYVCLYAKNEMQIDFFAN